MSFFRLDWNVDFPEICKSSLSSTNVVLTVRPSQWYLHVQHPQRMWHVGVGLQPIHCFCSNTINIPTQTYLDFCNCPLTSLYMTINIQFTNVCKYDIVFCFHLAIPYKRKINWMNCSSVVLTKLCGNYQSMTSSIWRVFS